MSKKEPDSQQSQAEGFWLFNGLSEEPYGMLPLGNLTAKGGPTGMKNYERLASYNWYMEDQQNPTIVVPGHPQEFKFWGGGLLHPDRGILIYDINHLKVPPGPLDAMILATSRCMELAKKPALDYSQYDVITDSLNLQKLFAFCSSAGEGLFRIDFERVGNTVVLNRVESSDLMKIDYESYDQTIKTKCLQNHTTATEGPFYQIASAQFGQLKMLLRFEADCADYTRLPGYKAPKTKKPGEDSDSDSEAEEAAAAQKKKDEEEMAMAVDAKSSILGSGEIHPMMFIPYGETKKHHLMTLTTYPQAGGFPFFTWAQLLFSGLDSVIVGWWKGTGDFSRPATYTMQDINKLMKPLPYAALSKVHDCLGKVVSFMKQNREELKVALVWKGKDFLEIYEKNDNAPGALSDTVKEFMKTQMEHMD